MAVVAAHPKLMAQMILNNKPMGVHVFFVQLRGSDLKPLKGIDMGDIGPKLGDNDTPIGYLRMNQVSIPRRHLMLSYKAPVISGVNMFEGKTKLSLTQFVSGDAFGEASRRVRVSQVASDFTDASGIWQRATPTDNVFIHLQRQSITPMNSIHSIAKRSPHTFVFG